MHDPRAYSGMAAVYALSPRGACHMQGDLYTLDLGQGGLEALSLIPGERQENTQEKGKTAARLQAWRNLYNSLILCQFENPGVSLLLGALNAATGWDLEAGDLMSLGKQILNIKRMMNIKLGLTIHSDRLPELFLQPLKAGGSAGFTPDMPTLLAGAYAELGWDPKNGRPLDAIL
jgi:aldehyde:ferredoxin oxidoreductase